MNSGAGKFFFFLLFGVGGKSLHCSFRYIPYFMGWVRPSLGAYGCSTEDWDRVLGRFASRLCTIIKICHYFCNIGLFMHVRRVVLMLVHWIDWFHGRSGRLMTCSITEVERGDSNLVSCLCKVGLNFVF